MGFYLLGNMPPVASPCDTPLTPSDSPSVQGRRRILLIAPD